MILCSQRTFVICEYEARIGQNTNVHVFAEHLGNTYTPRICSQNLLGCGRHCVVFHITIGTQKWPGRMNCTIAYNVIMTLHQAG